jgi:hypothetical protein
VAENCLTDEKNGINKIYVMIYVEDHSEIEYLDAHVVEEEEDVEGVEEAQPGNKSSQTWKM